MFKTWKLHFISIVLMINFFLVGCASKQHRQRKPVTYKEATEYKKIKLPEKEIKIPDELLEPVILFPDEQTAAVEILGKKVSFNVYNVTFKDMIEMFREAMSVDIIYGEDIDVNKRFNLQIYNKTFKEVLDRICDLLDYYYQVEGKTIYFKSLETRYYDIGIPKIVIRPDITVSGNILSGGGSIGATGGTAGSAGGGVTGEVTFSFDDLQNENPYKRLEEMVRQVLSPRGKLLMDEDTGFMKVTDKRKVLNEVDKIVQRFKYFYSKQVEVEVTIIEVVYNKGRQSSINWSAVFSKIAGDLKMKIVQGPADLQLLNYEYKINHSDSLDGIIFQASNDSFSPDQVVLNFLKKYGHTEIVSSPKLRLTNGYSAMVVAGTVKPYFKKTEEFSQPATTTTGGETTSKIENWEIMNYLQGVLLNVKVRVNNQNDIFLQVTPMITDILAEKETEDKKITAPIIMMRQATTILKLHNNDIAILGGLKGKRVTRDESGVPYLMNLKGIGNLARSKKLEIEDTEIVMIIRARLVY